jgi:hypothetical protein
MDIMEIKQVKVSAIMQKIISIQYFPHQIKRIHNNLNNRNIVIKIIAAVVMKINLR